MKFNHIADEFVYENVEDNSGESEAPTGWFGRLDMRDRDVIEAGFIEHYGTPFVIVQESNEGFVTVLPFETKEKRDERYADLERAYGLYSGGITPEQAREAIDGYHQAMMFTATDENGDSLDGLGLAFSPAAQKTMNHDVLDFLGQNAAEIHEFCAVTRHGFLQVGIDFSLTRNRHGAGFWDRGAGQVGAVLTEAAHPWGEQSVYVGDSGELEVQ